MNWYRNSSTWPTDFSDWGSYRHRYGWPTSSGVPKAQNLPERHCELNHEGETYMSATLDLNPPQALAVNVRPLQPTIGAEIDGVDLRQPLPPAVRDAIKQAVLKYKVVFFRDQAITREQQADFARTFGP